MRLGYRIIAIKLVLVKEMLDIISAYMLQVGLEEHSRKIWENVDVNIHGITIAEKLIIGRDLDGHISRNNNNYE